VATEEPLAFRVVRGGLFVAASSYFNILFGFIANLVLTRLLAPEAFGIFALAMFFFSLLNLRPKIGVGQAFAQRPTTTGELIGTHLALDVAAGLGSFVLALVAVPILLAFGYTRPVVWVTLALATVGISQSVMGTAWVLLDKELLFGRVSLVTTLAFPLSYVPAFALAVRGGGYWSLVAQNAAYAILLLVGLWWACRRYMPQVWQMRWRFNRVIAREFIRFGAMVGLATIAGTLALQFDNFLVGSLVSVETLGFYDRAYRIAQWPTLLVSSVLTRPAFYAYAKLQDDAARLTKTFTMTSWLITTLALPLALAIFASAPDLVRLLYGERWLPSALFLRFLVVYSLLRPLLDNAGLLFVAVANPHRTTIIRAVQAVVLMAIATPLTLAYGAVGTCVGVGMAFVVGLALSYRYVRRTVALSLRDAFAVPAVAAVLAIGAYLLLARGVDLNVLPLVVRVMVKAGFAAAAFFAVMLAVQPRRLIERSAYIWRLLWAGRRTDCSEIGAWARHPEGNMKYEEYIQAQITSSAWTRQSPNSMALARDAAREFYNFVSSNSRILELGCGDGYLLGVLRKKDYRHLTGIDINWLKLKVALSNGHRVSVQDIHSLALPDEFFDAVYCAHTLEHTYDGYRAMREIARVLRPGGIAFVIVPDHINLYGETFMEPDQVIPIEQRPLDYFDRIPLQKKGTMPSVHRNQFPFTMKLLVAVIIRSGLELQQISRIKRDGPELWALASKSKEGTSEVEPLLTGRWTEPNPIISRLSHFVSAVYRRMKR